MRINTKELKKYPLWKAFLDYSVSSIAIFVLLPVFLLLLIAASLDTGGFGIFRQTRIGIFGKPFTIFKFRTYHIRKHSKSAFGNALRRTKIDELPQLFNIILGEMSLVGPRPDIPGYYDALSGEARKILQLKPGLTSEAGILFRDEEQLLSQQENPLAYNDEILFPEKVQLNLKYYHEMSFRKDAEILLNTAAKLFFK